MSLFPDLGPAARPPDTYEEFWNSLTKDPKYEYYRGHQIKVLDEYERLDPTVKDAAVALPTGTGKTIVALSLGGLSQRRKPKTVLYLCPTKQLAKQVLDEARGTGDGIYGFGVPAADLTGAWDDVPSEAKEAYTRGKAIGVASYWTLFNSNPKIGTPDLIIFDDVHAAADAALNPWALVITRDEHGALFESILNAIKESAPNDIVSASPNVTPEKRVTLIKHRHWLMSADTVQGLLTQHAEESDLKYPWRRLNGKLPRCFCFLSPDTITIRPWLPPTFTLPAFQNAKRRVYLTATLDRWGHLEHVMGIPEARRLPSPSVPVPGRRLILNLDRLWGSMNELTSITTMAKSYGERVLILCRNNRDRDDVIQALKKADYPGDVFGAGDTGANGLDAEVAKFRDSPRAALVLANRYDGLDLGNGVCTNLILWKLPAAIGVQEEFLTNVWGLQQAADARARQRIQQGLGRCTRREQDSVVVGLVGPDLNSFIQRADVQSALPPRLRAELEFSSRIRDQQKVDAYVNAALKRNADWTKAGKQMDDLAGTYTDDVNAADDEIAQVHRKESSWNMLFWAGDFPAAARVAANAAQDLLKLKDHNGSAAWSYLASVSEDTHMFTERSTPYSDPGVKFLTDAKNRAPSREWYAALSGLTDPPQVAPANEAQVRGVLDVLKRFPQETTRLRDTLAEARADLSQTEAKKYHRGLRTLGESLGLKTESPSRDAGADCVWSHDRLAIVIFEAKTDKKNDFLSVEEVRQILSLPDGARNVDGYTVPPGLQTVAVTPVRSIAPEALHDAGKFLVARPDDVLAFAAAWFDRLEGLHTRVRSDSQEARYLVEAALRQLNATTGRLQAGLNMKPGAKCLKPTSPAKAV